MAGVAVEHGGRRTVRRVFVDVLRLTGAAGSAQAIALAAAPLISRAYDPAAFGRFAVITAVIALLLPLASLRYELAIVLPEKEEQAIELLALCLILVAASSLAIAVLVAVAGPLLADKTNLGDGELIELPLAIGVMSLHGLLMGWLVRCRAVAQLGLMRFATVIGTVICQIVLSRLQPGTSGLILGLVAGHSIGLAVAVKNSRRAFARCITAINPQVLTRVAAEYRAFAIFTAPGGVLNVLGSQIASLLMPALYGPVIAGQSALAQRVVGQPAVLVGAAVNQVFWADAARLFVEDPERLWHLFLRINVILLVAMLPTFLLTCYGGQIFAFVFGAAWQDAGRFAGIFILAEILGLPAHATTCLHGYRLNYCMTAWDVARLSLIGLALGIAWHFSLSPLTCITLMSAALATANLILFVLNAAAILRGKSAAAREAATAPRLLTEVRGEAV
jgi:O-antigen/teichoic acid export membrane protein